MHTTSLRCFKRFHRPSKPFMSFKASADRTSDPFIATHANRLSTEQSPYLLQHAQNPVDWYPWGSEALQRSKEENKPIFLSVGYSTCHWCHVMERESFEDAETAKIMNENFINIKVDREERPDVDRVYMTFVQATTGQGGWPMSVFLTPELEPMYGGTYYPKRDMFQGGQLAMPSFQTVLRRISTMWSTNREDLKRKGSDMMTRLGEVVGEAVGSGASDVDIDHEEAESALLSCEEGLAKRFDSILGGFGGAPKFPRPCEIDLLLRTHVWHKVWQETEECVDMSRGDESKAAEALLMATASLDKMAAGGMYDHIGAGFHRYSVDEFWHVPHLTENQSYATVARGILDYLRRDMTHPEGGIFSAEDADSLDMSDGQKKEGAFYIWTRKEVESALGGKVQAEVFCRAYNIREEGNCTLSEMSDPHDEFGGKNVPILLHTIQSLARELGIPEDQLDARLAEQRKVLHAVRSSRPRPGLDDKIVAAWNGVAISAFALASRALSAESPPCPVSFPVDGCAPGEYLEAALKAARFARRRLYDEQRGTLWRSYRNGPSAVPGFADDYANMVAGCLDLFECGGGVEWLQWAVRLQATQDRLFRDPDRGGYFGTSGDDPSIKIRIKDDYDGAEPTASSISALNLFRLAALAPLAAASSSASLSGGYSDQARRVLAAFGERLSDSALAVPKMCCAAFLALGRPLRQVVVATANKGGESRLAEAGMGDWTDAPLLNAAHAAFVPDKAVIVIDLLDEDAVRFFSEFNPEALAMAKRHFAVHPGHGPTAFICQNFTCQNPTSDPSKVVQLLKSTVGKPSVVQWPGFPLTKQSNT